jgi:AcrR family transcriptional regulator
MGEKSKNTKALFLDVAKDLFLEKSFSDVTVAEICEKAGKAKGLFFYYFEQKEDILKSLALVEVEEMKQQFSDYISNDSSSNLEKLQFLMHALISPNAEMPLFMRFFGKDAPPDFFEGYVHELRDESMLPMIQMIVKNGIEADEFEKVSADEISLIYMGVSTYMHRNFNKMVADKGRYIEVVKTIQGVIEKALGISAGSFQI